MSDYAERLERTNDPTRLESMPVTAPVHKTEEKPVDFVWIVAPRVHHDHAV